MPEHQKFTCSPPRQSTTRSTHVFGVLIYPAFLKAAETLAAEADRVIGPTTRSLDALGAKCMGALDSLRADIVDQVTPPTVPGHAMRRLHATVVLRGFARRHRPRYADDAQWTRV